MTNQILQQMFWLLYQSHIFLRNTNIISLVKEKMGEKKFLVPPSQWYHDISHAIALMFCFLHLEFPTMSMKKD